MTDPNEQAVEVVRSPREGRLSIWMSEDLLEEEIGQEATLVEEQTSPKTALGSIFKSMRKSRKKKTNIILPPQINLAQTDARRHEANQKADYARRLLEAAFRPDGAAKDKDDPAEFKGMKKDDMIRTAFKYAVEARQLRSNNNLLNDALQEHRGMGEAQAFEARRFMLASKSRALLTNMDAGEEDDGSINGGLYTPQDIQDAAGKHLDEARFHLEQILAPFEKKIVAPAHIILNKTSNSLRRRGDEDLTLSTLGFDNTFQQEPSPNREFSITSLNEIMDESLKAEPLKAPKPISPITEAESKMKAKLLLCKRREDDEVAHTKVKPGTILMPPRSRTRSTLVSQVVADQDEESDISEISEIESIRALESQIGEKLKKAAASDDDGEFSLVEETSLGNEPRFIRAPVVDLKIMSVENWDNLTQGGSLDDILARSLTGESARPEAYRQPVIEPPPSQRGKGWRKGDRKRSGVFVKRKSRREKKPVVYEAHPQFATENMKIIGYEDVTTNAVVSIDELPPAEPRSVASPDEAAVMTAKRWNNLLNMANGRKGQGSEAANKPSKWGIGPRRMRSCDRDLSSMNCVSEADTKEDFGDNYQVIVEDADSVDEQTRERLESKNPIVSDVDMMANRGDPKLVREVFSAEDGNVEDEDANKIDFAPVEVGADDAVRTTQKALVSRDAVIQNIYADRASMPKASSLERSRTVANGPLQQDIQPSSSFMEMIEREKTEVAAKRKEEGRRMPKGLISLFSWKKGKNTAPLPPSKHVKASAST